MNSIDERIASLRGDLKEINDHAEAILRVYMRSEAVFPSIIYDLKKAGVLKWLEPSIGDPK